MKFTQRIHVVGMKSSKGTLENGTGYDSTKVYALVDLDASKGTAKGMASSDRNAGRTDSGSELAQARQRFPGLSQPSGSPRMW